MDLRVLAAVFLTLFAVAVGMAQGDVEVGEVRQSLNDLRTGVDLSDALTQQQRNASGAAPVTGELTAPGSVDLSVGTPARIRFTADTDTAVEVDGSTVSPAPNTTITVDGFTGDIHISPSNATVTGVVSRFSTSQVAFDYTQDTQFAATVTTPRLAVSGLRQQTIRFGNATGTVSADATEIQVDGEQAVLHGFTGNLSVDRAVYMVDGTVASAALGDAKIN